jgi:hypothetical protein
VQSETIAKHNFSAITLTVQNLKKERKQGGRAIEEWTTIDCWQEF